MKKLLRRLLLVAVFCGISVSAVGQDAFAASSTISGTLRDSANVVANGAYVYATAPGDQAILYGPVVSNSTGFYSLLIGESGTYDIHYIAPANKPWTSILDSSLAVSSNQTINKNFVSKTSTLSGVLRTSDGDPLPSTTVKLGGYQTNTNSLGAYSLTVPSGNYALGIIGGDNAVNGLYSFNLQQSTAGINLQDGDKALDLNLKLARAEVTPKMNNGGPGYSLVTARATSGTTSLYPDDPGTAISVSWSDQITITANYGVNTGTITTIAGSTFTGSGLESSVNTTSLCKNISGASTYDCLRIPLTIKSDISLDLPSYAPAVRTYSGVLTDSDNNPIANANIKLTRYNDVSVVAYTNTNGEFTMNAMAKKYALSINIPGMVLTQPTATPGIDLTASNKVQDLQIPTATVTVSAMTGGGLPAYQAEVEASSNSGTAYLYTGDPGFKFVIGSSIKVAPSGTNVVTFNTLKGATYIARGSNVAVGQSGSQSICVKQQFYTQWNCLNSPVTIANTGNTNVNAPQ